MKHIKTYEGLFDFFKKNRRTEPVSYDEINDCLYDIIDEPRIITSLKNHREDFGIHVSPYEISKNGFRQAEVGDLNFNVGNFDLVFIMKYYPFGEIIRDNGNHIPSISDEEVNNLLEGVKAHLESIGCEMSFYVGFGYSEGRTSSEYSNFMTMINREASGKMKLSLLSAIDFRKMKDRVQRERHVTVRIKSKTGFTQ